MNIIWGITSVMIQQIVALPRYENANELVADKYSFFTHFEGIKSRNYCRFFCVLKLLYRRNVTKPKYVYFLVINNYYFFILVINKYYS